VPDQWEGDGVLLWADTERILEAVREGDADGELFGAPDVLRALGMLEALGVTTIGPVTQTLVMDGAGTRALFSVPWDGETVLGRAASAVMRPRRPELLQLASPKVYAAVALNVDWTAAFDEGVDLAVEFGGMELADVAATMAELDAGLGFSLRDELLVNLDGRLGVFSVEVEPAEAFTLAGPTPVPMNFVLVLGLSDGEAMRTLVDTAVDASPMRAALTREDFQGFDVHRLPAGMPGLTLFWALTDDVLVASLAPTPVHDVLRRKLSGELPSLAADEQVAAALARLPADASVLRLEKGATSFRGIFDQLSMVAQLGRADMPEAVIGPLLEAMAGLGDLDPAILEKYLDRRGLAHRRERHPRRGAGAVGASGPREATPCDEPASRCCCWPPWRRRHGSAAPWSARGWGRRSSGRVWWRSSMPKAWARPDTSFSPSGESWRANRPRWCSAGSPILTKPKSSSPRGRSTC
jgi:hypothetical protein